MNTYAKWFCRVLWLAIVIDVLLGLAALFFPNTTLRAFGMRASDDIFWTAFGAMAILMVALLFSPAARDPYRYRLTARYAVIAKGLFAAFFLVLWPGYPLFGFLDLAFLIALWVLYWLGFRGHQPEWHPQPSAS